MAGRSFLDTNILVYSFDASFPTKQDRAASLVRQALRDGSGVLSFQVVQECLHVMLRKFRDRAAGFEARSYLEQVLMPLCAVFPDRVLYSNALEISTETGWSFYDSLIVSAAIAGNCDRLLTEDLQHGREIRGVRIENPFL